MSRLRLPERLRWGAVGAAIGIVLRAAYSLIAPASAQTGIDYDTDNDGLIEVANLNQLSAIRWILTGDGTAESKLITYPAAYPNALASPLMDCPSGCIGYELNDDFDFAGREWASGPGWTPVGNGLFSFNAKFDGGGFAIANLFILLPSTSGVGLFGLTGTRSEILNVTLVDVDVTGSSWVGGLVGQSQAPIEGSQVSGAVTGQDRTGGLVGQSFGQISRSVAAGDVRGAGQTNGGLVGMNEGDISQSAATGTVRSYAYAGVLVGFHRKSGRIVSSHASGDVTAITTTAGDSGTQAGGLVGGRRRQTLLDRPLDGPTADRHRG